MRRRSAPVRRRRLTRTGAVALAGAAAVPLLLPTAVGAQDGPPVLCTPDVLADATDFVDVPESSPHHAAVACLSAYGITTGTSATSFSPNAMLRRDQAAGLMARAAELVEDLPAGSDAFVDDEGSIFEPAINSLHELDVIDGRSVDHFAPGGSLTRGQAASLAIRTLRLFGDVEPGPDAFTDDDGSVHEANIDAAAALGIVDGFGDGTFGPNTPVTRAQGASIMAATLERAAALVVAEMEAGR